MSFPIAIIFGVLAMFGYGLNNAISKVPVKKVGEVKTIFYRNVFISIIYLIVLIIFLQKANFDFQFILIAFAISLLGYIPFVSFYKALEKGSLGIVSPIANSSVIITILFSVLFFKESLNFIQILSIISVIIGIFLISLDFKNLKSSSFLRLSTGVPYALLSCFLWGIVFFLFKIPVNILGPILTSFIIEFGITIFSALHLKIQKISFALPSRQMLKYIFLVSIFGAIGTLSFTFGISIYNVSIIAAIAFANPLIAVIYGKFIYKEKLKLQQWLAIGIILCGIVLISYF